MTPFESNIICTYGEKGKIWLEALPKIIDERSRAWGLSHLKAVDNLSYNYVLSGMRGTDPVILKLGLDVRGLQRESVALKAFKGFGAVCVLKVDEGALLLERAVPGVSLRSYYPAQEAGAFHIACDVIKRLHQAPFSTAAFPHITEWLSLLDHEWEMPPHYLTKARILRDRLLETPDKPVLLHGDLHHDNILQMGDDFVVIDPKGVIGYPIHEVWAFMGNPRLDLPPDIILSRINGFSHTFDWNPQLIINWCFVQSVLSWVWDLEDNIKPSSVGLTEILEKLTK